MDKIAFVCQRYGNEINGGAELYCKKIAEKLSEYYDITVYTSCAIDYITWRNEYPEGETVIDNVTVKRFRVEKERNIDTFNELSNKVYLMHSTELEATWIEEQGPYVPSLIDEIKLERKKYKAILFMTYLYYTTARGITEKIDNAILIPTVHDEPPVYLRYYDRVFDSAKGIVWNSIAEKAFAEKRFPKIKFIKNDIIGIGIDKIKWKIEDLPENIKDSNYIVYVGRIDKNKGCDEMFAFFRLYNQRNEGKLKLVLIGKPMMDIPEDKNIIPLGFVDEKTKAAVVANSLALVLHSKYESLSMVVLESMILGKPVIVSEKCDVLKDHCIQSNAGLYFNNFYEYEMAINYMLKNRLQYKLMQNNGISYVTERYSWRTVVQKYKAMIEGI